MSARRHRPVAVERDAALYALGLDPANVRWDHRPALSVRERLPDGRYVPDENDPRYIVPLAPEAHDKRTFGTSKATTAGSDIAVAAKIKRVVKERAEFVATLLARAGHTEPPTKKGKRAWPKRPFPARRR